MVVINSIKKTYKYAQVVRCYEKGCELKLNGLRNYIVLKGERICESHRICDCIIFTGDSHIIIVNVELKSKTIHASEVIEKLTNGSQLALDILAKCSKNQPTFEFYHLVLCKSWRPPEYKVITREKIIIRGKRYSIIPKRCGVSFSAVISSLR